MTDQRVVSSDVQLDESKKGFLQSLMSWFKMKDQYFLRGIGLYIAGFFYWRIWLYMGMADIRRRYRRSYLGPFWVTLSLAIFIATMGVLFPVLWHTNVKTYIPFFSSGFIIWTFFSTMITDSCGTFLDVGGLIKQISLPYTLYSNAVVMRNFLIFLHHSVVYLVVMLLFHVPVNFNTLLIFPALIILCLTGSWVSILVGLLALRFRDTKQLIVSLLQVSMFVTPVFWTPAQLGGGVKARIIVDCNPLYHFIEIARAPLIGQQPDLLNWIVTISFCLLGWWFTMRILGKYYRHVVFWL